MSDTSLSLLQRLQLHPEDSDWNRLVGIYTPLILGWLRRSNVSVGDADDIVQEVLAVVVKELPRFRHEPHPGSFRGWLRTITVFRLKNYWRARHGKPQGTGDSDFARMLEQLEDPHSNQSQLWDREHDQHVMNRLLAVIEPEFNATNWRAFHRQVVDGARAADVAAELGVSTNVVLLAKSRILRRLRREAEGLIE
jgi:RNA polymerase sigma-70 factor (ECF subfamily)